MGETAGLAQTTGEKAAHGLLAASRQAGRLFAIPSKLRSLVTHQTEKKRRAEVRREIKHLRRRINVLHTRIGERVCNSPLLDRPCLPADPQVEAMVSAVQDLEAEVRQLEQELPGCAAIPLAQEHEDSIRPAGPTEPGGADAPLGDTGPSPGAPTE